LSSLNVIPGEFGTACSALATPDIPTAEKLNAPTHAAPAAILFNFTIKPLHNQLSDPTQP